MRVMRPSPTSGSSDRRPAGACRRLVADRRGAVAVEFAMVSIPFFLLLFAILEMALMFFVGQLLDTSTMSASRLIRTGEANAARLSQVQFKAKVCAGMVDLADCDNRLYVDVQSYSSFGAYTPTSPLDKDGNITKTSYTYGDKSQIIVVRSFYAWPVLFNILSGANAKLSNGDQLLGAVVAFQTEPF